MLYANTEVHKRWMNQSTLRAKRQQAKEAAFIMETKSYVIVGSVLVDLGKFLVVCISRRVTPWEI